VSAIRPVGDWNVSLREPEASSNIAASEVVELLSSLVDKNLVVADGDRYRLLETVRQYGRGRLNDAGESDYIRKRHLFCFLAVAEEAEPQLTGPGQQSWLERLDAEHDNLRAALDWSVESADGGEPGLRLGGAVWRFWSTRGHLGEGRGRFSVLLAHEPDERAAAARAKALNGAGVLALLQSDCPAARTLHEESLTVKRELGDQQGIASSLNNLGDVAHYEGDHAAARALYEESLAIWRELGDRRGVAVSLSNLGNAAYGQGVYAAARPLYEESLAIFKELGDRWGIAYSLNNLGLVAHAEGDYPAALALLKECLQICRELGDPWAIAVSLQGLALVAAAVARPDRAARLWGAAERLRDEIGGPLPQNERSRYEQRVAAACAALGAECFDRAWQEGRAMTWEQAVEYALSEEPS
jgi:non-specific serine/threonine protein kinase